MPKLDVLNQEGSKVGDIELAENIFGIEPNEHVLFDVVIMQQAAKRQGTHATKNRALVSGGGRKPWRQKGTGRARQGSIRAPQWVGGGVVFGPTPRSYAYKLPKKVRRLALKSALSAKVLDNEIYVLEKLTFEKPKTKDFVAFLNNLSLDTDTKALVVTGELDENIYLSARNLPKVKVVDANGINVLDLVGYDKLIITKDAVEKVEEVLA